jgi:dedicator of cytokinesis protein 3
MVLKLKKAIDRQAVIISRCLLLHSRLCPAEMRPFHDTLDRFFRQNFAEEIARLELESASTSNDTGDAITNGQEDATGMTHSVTNGTMERSTSYSTINGIRSEGGGAEAPSLDLASVASDLRSTPVKISPLQQHIAYLAKQSQPIKSSPTAVLETNTSATSNARRVSAGVATDTPLDAQSISTVTGKQPSAIAGQAAVPATNPNLTSVYGAPSVMSGTSYAATNKGTQPSILSAVTKGGRERASRLFGSVRKR